jgi:hypothetical protein
VGNLRTHESFHEYRKAIRSRYLRDQHGNEIDCVVRVPEGLIPVEFKAGRTYSADWAAPMRRWSGRTPQWSWLMPTIVYGGDESDHRSGVRVLSWRDFAQDPLGGFNRARHSQG